MRPISSFYDESRVKAKTRQSILEASVQLFYTSSLSGLTMQEVAQKAGLTSRNLYRYYETRNLLIVDVVYFVYTLFEEEPMPALNDAGNGWQQLKLVLDYHYLDPYQYTAAKGVKLGTRLGFNIDTGTALWMRFEIDHFILNLPSDDPAFVRYTELYVPNMGVRLKEQLQQVLLTGAQDGSLRLEESEVPFYQEYIRQTMRSIGSRVMLKQRERSSISFTMVQKTADMILYYLKSTP